VTPVLGVEGTYPMRQNGHMSTATLLRISTPVDRTELVAGDRVTIGGATVWTCYVDPRWGMCGRSPKGSTRTFSAQYSYRYRRLS
jgi:hypothetical protein